MRSRRSRSRLRPARSPREFQASSSRRSPCRTPATGVCCTTAILDPIAQHERALDSRQNGDSRRQDLAREIQQPGPIPWPPLGAPATRRTPSRIASRLPPLACASSSGAKSNLGGGVKRRGAPSPRIARVAHNGVHAVGGSLTLLVDHLFCASRAGELVDAPACVVAATSREHERQYVGARESRGGPSRRPAPNAQPVTNVESLKCVYQ